MKKILCLILVSVTMLSLVACGNNDSTEPTESNKQTESTQPDTTKPDDGKQEGSTEETDNPEITDETIRENGKIPSDKEEWTTAEKNYIQKELYHKVVQAVIDLDFEILKQYATESSLSQLKEIEENADFKKMYENTYGKMIYLPDSESMLMKSTRYTYSKWFTNFYLTNTILPDNINSLTKEDVDNVYNSIYVNAPYEVVEFETTSIAIKIVDGYIKYDLEAMFYDIDAFRFHNMTPSAYQNAYAKYIFGDEFNVKPNFNILGEHREILEAVYDFNPERILAYLEIHCGEYPSSTEKNVLEYYRNKDNHSKMREWFVENCEVMVSNGSMHIYYITNSFDVAKRHFPFTTITESDYEKINNLTDGYGVWQLVSKEDQHAYTQRDLIDMMKDDKILE